MRTLSLLVALSALFAISSCEKKEKKQDASYYYSTDFKLAEGTVLDIPVNDIDYLYTVFFYEGKVLKYKLVAERSDKKEGVLAYQEGTADVDEELNILFIPDINTFESYVGYFENDKKNFKVTLPGLDSREINFELK